jgi:hypothetical protein
MRIQNAAFDKEQYNLNGQKTESQKQKHIFYVYMCLCRSHLQGIFYYPEDMGFEDLFYQSNSDSWIQSEKTQT